MSLPFSLYYQLRGVSPYQLSADGHSQREREGSSFKHSSICPGDTVGQTPHTEEQSKSNTIDGCNDSSLHSRVTRTVGLSPGIQIRWRFVPVIHYLRYFLFVFPERRFRMMHYDILIEVNTETNEVAQWKTMGYSMMKDMNWCLVVEIVHALYK